MFSALALPPNPVGRVAFKVKLVTNGNDLSNSTHTTKRPLTLEAWVWRGFTRLNIQICGGSCAPFPPTVPFAVTVSLSSASSLS